MNKKQKGGVDSKSVKEKTIIKKTSQPAEEKERTRTHILSDFNIPGYFREVSVVIIGVLATLFITGIINDYNKQKEIDSMLRFVRTELEENLENLQWIQQRWEGEQHLFKLLEENAANPESIPIDSLDKYSYAIGAIYNLGIKKDSYELLQNSMLIQYVKDKTLLRTLSKSYNAQNDLNSQLSQYSSQKRTIFLDPVLGQMKEEQLKNYLDGGNFSGFVYFMSQKEEFRKFTIISRTILSPPTIFENCKENIKETISIMEQNGY